MKWRLILVLFVFMTSCEDNVIERNPYLPNYSFEYEFNLNLPQYDNLRFTGGTHTINGLGVKGVHLYNLNGSQLMAWEASCPNHLPSDCSQTQITGVLAQCSCEDYQYSLATGQLLNPAEGQSEIYSMVMYQAILRGNTLELSN